MFDKCKCLGNCPCSFVDQVSTGWKPFLEDRKRKAEIEKKEEIVIKKQKQEERSKKELEEQFKMVKLEDISDMESVMDSEDEWEDVEEENKEKEKNWRNKRPLPILSAGCDMVGVSYRVGAFLANCALVENGIITLKNTLHTIDRTKLRRQRIFWGKYEEGEGKEAARALH